MKFCKLLAINAQPGQDRSQEYLLTAKKGLFFGVLAGKQGFWTIRKSDFFAFFHFFEAFSLCKLLPASIFQNI
jgi:hypothetical protein